MARVTAASILAVMATDGDWEIGGGLTGVGRFFTDPCGCGSQVSYGACCGAAEGTLFTAFCTKLQLDREVALEVGQLAWRIARDNPSARWFTRAFELAEELFHDDDERMVQLLRLVSVLLEAHHVIFPGVDGDSTGPN